MEPIIKVVGPLTLSWYPSDPTRAMLTMAGHTEPVFLTHLFEATNAIAHALMEQDGCIKIDMESR